MAVVAGVTYAAQGVILLREPRLQHWTDSDYVAYTLFATALLGSMSALIMLAVARAPALGRRGTFGVAVSSFGLGCLAATAAVRVVLGDEVLDPLFLLGFLMVAVGYLIFALATVRNHSLASVLPLLGVIGAIALQDEHGAGVWMGAVWAVYGVATYVRA
jgi:hypothetical protein